MRIMWPLAVAVIVAASAVLTGPAEAQTGAGSGGKTGGKTGGTTLFDLFNTGGSQPAAQSKTQSRGQVSVLTDGLADPDSRASVAVNELASRGRIGGLRVLPVAAQGAVANVRDLLYLRGVDLAVVNSDVLGFLDLTKQYPDARKQVRYVTSLSEQKVFLLVRREIGSLADLRGRRIAVPAAEGGSLVTARTLFGLTRTDAAVEALAKGAVLDDAALRRYDGALFLSGELPRVRLGAAVRDDYRLLPVAMTPALARDYHGAVIDVREGGGFATAPVDTVTVSTLLAVFNWTPAQPRYADVASFVPALFAALPGLRKASDSPWRQADVAARPPGWTRFAGAAPTQAQLAEAAAVERPAVVLAVAAPAGVQADAAVRRFRVVAAERPPLTDRRAGDGGVVAALLAASLRAAGRAGDLDIDFRPAVPVTGIGDGTVDFSLPWESADCDEPGDLGHASAALCDDVLYSEPLMQVVVGLFALADGGFDFASDDGVAGRTLCVPADRDLSVLNGQGRRWVAEGRVSVVRRPTLIACAGLVQDHDADAFVASDVEGRYVLARLGLQDTFRMAQRPLATRGVHVVVPRGHPQAEALVDAVNLGLVKLRGSDAWAAVVQPRLMKLWEAFPVAR